MFGHRESVDAEALGEVDPGSPGGKLAHQVVDLLLGETSLVLRVLPGIRRI